MQKFKDALREEQKRLEEIIVYMIEMASIYRKEI